jgi:hypothetical protein
VYYNLQHTLIRVCGPAATKTLFGELSEPSAMDVSWPNEKSRLAYLEAVRDTLKAGAALHRTSSLNNLTAEMQAYETFATEQWGVFYPTDESESDDPKPPALSSSGVSS